MYVCMYVCKCMYVCMYVYIGGNINICNHGDERFLETSTGQSACSRLRCPSLGMYVCMYVCMYVYQACRYYLDFVFVFSTGKLQLDCDCKSMYICIRVAYNL